MADGTEQQLPPYGDDGPLLTRWQLDEIRDANDGELGHIQREHYLRWLLDHADAMEKVLDGASTALAVARGSHDQACGIDMCGMCLIESTYEKVLRVLRSDLTDEEFASLRAASEYQPPTPEHGQAQQLAPSQCNEHLGGTFRIGMGGGMFYRCGCVWDNRPGKLVDGQPGPWFRGLMADERPDDQRFLDLQPEGLEHGLLVPTNTENTRPESL